MINKIKNIPLINYKLIGEPLTMNIWEKQINGNSLNKELPLEIRYNGSWCASFECTQCSYLVEFGENRYANFASTGLIFTKKYSETFLDIIQPLFLDIKKYKSSLSPFTFLIDSSFSIKNADILSIPILTLINFRCQKCDTEYLSKFRQGYPSEPSSANPKGMIGKIFIDEIIQIEINSNKTFIEVMEDLKK